MSFVTQRHKDIWKKHVKQLRSDIGRVALVRLKSVDTDCLWCIYDPVMKQSSGAVSPGYVWSTHPSYSGTYNLNICPNCGGKGTVLSDARTFNITVTKKDLVPNNREDDGGGKFPMGAIRITANLDDCLVSGTTDPTADTVFDRAINVEFDGDNWQVLNVSRAGLGDLESCRVIMERVNVK